MFNRKLLIAVAILCALCLSACGGRYSPRTVDYPAPSTQSAHSTAPVSPPQAIVAPALPPAQSSGTAKPKANPIRDEDVKEYAGLTVSLNDLSPSPGGPVVRADPPSGHTSSQLRAGDVILSLAGAPTTTACALYRRLRELAPRTQATIEILRDNKLMRGTILLSSERRVAGCG